MTARLAYAYGLVQALVGSVIFVVAGSVLAQQTLGVTRQPLPLIWPLAVLHVTVAQIPLREILGHTERAAVRGPLARGVRALLTLVLLTLGPVTYASDGTNAVLSIFFLALTAIGFVAAAVSRSDPWVWTLGMGLAGVGLEFITPWAPLSRFLQDVPVVAAAAVVGLTTCFYAFGGGTHLHGGAGITRVRRACFRS